MEQLQVSAAEDPSQQVTPAAFGMEQTQALEDAEAKRERKGMEAQQMLAKCKQLQLLCDKVVAKKQVGQQESARVADEEEGLAAQLEQLLAERQRLLGEQELLQVHEIDITDSSREGGQLNARTHTGLSFFDRVFLYRSSASSNFCLESKKNS